MNFPRNEFEAWALPHFSGGDAEAVIALMELDSKGDYRSDEMRAARDAWQQMVGQRDYLAAHVERLLETFNRIAIEGEGGMYSPKDLEDELCAIFSDGPDAGLALLKAEWQAEALESEADETMAEAGYLETFRREVAGRLRSRAFEYRRQAEEGASL